MHLKSINFSRQFLEEFLPRWKRCFQFIKTERESFFSDASAGGIRIGTFTSARGDLDSVRTEDFYSEFRKTLVEGAGEN